MTRLRNTEWPTVIEKGSKTMEQYEELTLEVIEFEKRDVIFTSGTPDPDGPEYGGEI